MKQLFRSFLLLQEKSCTFGDYTLEIARIFLHHVDHLIHDIPVTSGLHLLQSGSNGFEIRPELWTFRPTGRNSTNDVIGAIRFRLGEQNQVWSECWFTIHWEFFHPIYDLCRKSNIIYLSPRL